MNQFALFPLLPRSWYLQKVRKVTYFTCHKNNKGNPLRKLYYLRTWYGSFLFRQITKKTDWLEWCTTVGFLRRVYSGFMLNMIVNTSFYNINNIYFWYNIHMQFFAFNQGEFVSTNANLFHYSFLLIWNHIFLAYQ